MDLTLSKDDRFNMSKEQIICLWERHTLEMHCIIWLEICILDTFHPTDMVVHDVICNRIWQCWCWLNEPCETVPLLFIFYKDCVVLEGAPCWLCVDSEQLALHSIWVPLVLTLHAPHTLFLVVKRPTHRWKQALWWWSLWLFVTKSLLSWHFRTWILSSVPFFVCAPSGFFFFF